MAAKKPTKSTSKRSGTKSGAASKGAAKASAEATGNGGAPKVAVVGAGLAGLACAFGLQREGIDVTLYSERDADEVLNGRLTATAGIFRPVVEWERELGINLWDDRIPEIGGVHIDFSLEPRKLTMTIEGTLSTCQAVDLRLKHSDWMREFEARGGDLRIKQVTAADLNEISDENDITMVAAGKRSEIGGLFPRDPRRSSWTKPGRHLAMLTLGGIKGWSDRIDLRHPAKFSITAGEGEIYFIPFLHRDGEQCYSVVFEAQPNRGMDRFGGAKSAEEALEVARGIIHDYAPWEMDGFNGAYPMDELSWLAGALVPTVREPVGTLENGNKVMALGDTATLFDPISAQGANCGMKMAKFMTERIADAADGTRFDADWMRRTYDDFYDRHVRWAMEFNRLMLEPLKPEGRQVMFAASRSRAVADRFIQGFDDPRDLFPWLDDLEAGKAMIAQHSGKAAWRVGAAGRLSFMGRKAKRAFASVLDVPSHPAQPPVYRGA